MPQAAVLDQKDGSERIPSMLFHQEAEAIEDVGKRFSFGHHLENAILSSQQGLRPLAILDVRQDFIPPQNISLVIAERDSAP